MHIGIDKGRLTDTPRDLSTAARAGLEAGVKQSEKDLRDEARRISQKLADGVTSKCDMSARPMKAELVVSAIRPAQEARQGVVHEADGDTRPIMLRAQPAFDFAEVVAKGRPEVRPRRARAILIPISDLRLRAGRQRESFIRAGKEMFVARGSAKAVPANPFDERAVRRTDRVITDVVGDAVDASLARTAEKSS